jgi:hypothetical protein
MGRKQKTSRKHICLILSVFLLNIVLKSYRQFPKYHKNLLYVSFFNALYYWLCKRHLVWEFIPAGMNWRLVRYIHIITVSPLLVLAFLARIPNSFGKQAIYLVKWVMMATVVEYYIYREKLILYAHGWNVFWSGLLYALMFTFSHLFTKRPIPTLFLSFCSTVFFIIKFRVPLKRKHFSRKFDRLVDVYYHTFLEDIVSYWKYGQGR